MAWSQGGGRGTQQRRVPLCGPADVHTEGLQERDRGAEVSVGEVRHLRRLAKHAGDLQLVARQLLHHRCGQGPGHRVTRRHVTRADWEVVRWGG